MYIHDNVYATYCFCFLEIFYNNLFDISSVKTSHYKIRDNIIYFINYVLNH